MKIIELIEKFREGIVFFAGSTPDKVEKLKNLASEKWSEATIDHGSERRPVKKLGSL